MQNLFQPHLNWSCRLTSRCFATTKPGRGRRAWLHTAPDRRAPAAPPGQATFVNFRRPNTHRNLHLPLTNHNRMTGNAHFHPLGCLGCPFQDGLRQQDNELLPAVARHHVYLAHHLQAAPGHFIQNLVSGEMPVGIVNLFSSNPILMPFSGKRKLNCQIRRKHRLYPLFCIRIKCLFQAWAQYYTSEVRI